MSPSQGKLCQDGSKIGDIWKSIESRLETLPTEMQVGISERAQEQYKEETQMRNI
jgi:hypothetical protein